MVDALSGLGPEVAQLALCCALALAGAGAALGLAGAQRQRVRWMVAADSVALGQLAFTALAFGLLIDAFVSDDFTVKYVASNSNTLLPWYYKVSAVWGGHEGSFLLWTLVMGVWMSAVVLFSRSLPAVLRARVIGVMALMNVGFLSFLIFTSNPFERLLPLAPVEGSDLNPLLQDFGLIIHPPMLYIGYVGFSVAFAFAVAALLGGRLDAAWARWARPWTNVAWVFLTIGITLGSWWAYYELGWGGWWFWDPVENASFMPWLVGTALIHSLAVTEKRGVFKSWTVLLSLAAFSLSLLGAFIVRSGVLTSVHAFAVDPERGVFILAFLVLVVGGSLLLYALRAPTVRARVGFDWLSRETALLVNNLVFVVAMAVVLIGTLTPLAYEFITEGGKLSVGEPYFNMLFIPLMVLIALVLAAAPLVRWKRTRLEVLKPLLLVAAAVVLGGAGLMLVLAGGWHWQVLLAAVLALWIVGGHGVDLWRLARAGSLRTAPGAYWGMTLAHLGFAMAILGVTVTSHLSLERDLRLAPGESVDLAGLRYEFRELTQETGPNYLADRGHFLITEADGRQLWLYPEKRRYLSGGNIMTEAGIDAGVLGDHYVSLGERLGEGPAWAVRVQYKPLVRWVWFGGVFMALGGFWAVTDKRYRRLRERQQQRATGAAGATA